VCTPFELVIGLLRCSVGLLMKLFPGNGGKAAGKAVEKPCGVRCVYAGDRKKYTKLCYIAEANDQQIGRVAANGLEM